MCRDGLESNEVWLCGEVVIVEMMEVCVCESVCVCVCVCVGVCVGVCVCACV